MEISYPKTSKTCYAGKYSCAEWIPGSFYTRYGRRNSIQCAQIIHTCVNMLLGVCRTGRKIRAFSSGLPVVSTQCGSEALWHLSGNLCDRSAFDFALWKNVIILFFLFKWILPYIYVFFFFINQKFLGGRHYAASSVTWNKQMWMVCGSELRKQCESWTGVNFGA